MYLAACTLLFVFGVLSRLGVVAGQSWQPVRFIALTGGMLLQAIASTIRTRSRPTFYGLLATSIGCLIASALVRQ